MARPAARALAAMLGGSLAITSMASCSLLAPSDEEAMAELAGDRDSSGGDGTAAETSTDAGSEAKVETGSTVCPGCQVACNEGQCSACYLNGAPCNGNAECCGGVCNAQGTCGAIAGSCAADNTSCTITPDSCCPGLTCSSERGSRCEACRDVAQNCKGDTDCCSLNCEGSTCAACIPTGTSGCTRPRQCCSGTCNAGTCG